MCILIGWSNWHMLFIFLAGAFFFPHLLGPDGATAPTTAGRWFSLYSTKRCISWCSRSYIYCHLNTQQPNSVYCDLTFFGCHWLFTNFWLLLCFRHSLDHVGVRDSGCFGCGGNILVYPHLRRLHAGARRYSAMWCFCFTWYYHICMWDISRHR